MATTQKTASLVVHPSNYSTTYSSFNNFNTSYPETNMYSDASSSTYAYALAKTTTGSTSYISVGFDLSSIPSDATINSVTCSAKYRVSNTTNISTCSVQLYNNNTAKGTANTTKSTTASKQTITAGTWTRTELNNLLLRFSMTRGSRTTAAGIYIYGADLTIDYTYNEVAYTVTVTSSGDGITTPTGITEVAQGDTFKLSCIPTNSDDTITVIDNGVDVSDQLVDITTRADIGETVTVTLNPSTATTNGNITGTAYRSAIGKASSDTSNTSNDYCSTNGSTAYIDYSFDLSSIDFDSVAITNVECIVCGHAENASQSSSKADAQLYADGTAKGSVTSFSSSTNTTYTLDTGTWTKAELQNLTLRFTIGYYGGAISGVDLKITYIQLGEGGALYTYTIDSTTENHTISVTYSPAVTYTVTTNIKNGTLITPSQTSVTVRDGNNLTFAFKGNDEFVFKKMLVNSTQVTPTEHQEGGETPTYEVSTNYGTYQTYALSNATDGDTSTCWWSSETQATGKYILITFSDAVNLTSFQTYSSNSTDYPNPCNELQVSTDGTSWTTVGTFSDSQTTTFNNITNAQGIKYARIYATSTIESWMVINEITMTYSSIGGDMYYMYTLTNIHEDKTVTILFGGNDAVFIKINGQWKETTSYYIKVNGSWTEKSVSEINNVIKNSKVVKR